MPNIYIAYIYIYIRTILKNKKKHPNRDAMKKMEEFQTSAIFIHIPKPDNKKNKKIHFLILFFTVLFCSLQVNET